MLVAAVVALTTLVEAVAWLALQTTPVSATAAEILTGGAKTASGKVRTDKKGSDTAGSTAVDGNRTVPRPASRRPLPPGLPPGLDLAGKLRENGAGSCAAEVNGLAAGVMGGVTAFNTASHWMVGTPDKRAISVLVGQKFAETGPVPFGATGIFAAPNGVGSCDGVAIQVVPSPLPCAKIRETLSGRGRLIGDLAGVPLMEDAGEQTLLVPTSADTCVLVGMKASYAG